MADGSSDGFLTAGPTVRLSRGGNQDERGLCWWLRYHSRQGGQHDRTPGPAPCRRPRPGRVIWGELPRRDGTSRPGVRGRRGGDPGGRVAAGLRVGRARASRWQRSGRLPARPTGCRPGDLLGLEVLIIADIVLTITVDRTLTAPSPSGSSFWSERSSASPWRSNWRGRCPGVAAPRTSGRNQPSASATDQAERSARLQIVGQGVRCLPPGPGHAAQPMTSDHPEAAAGQRGEGLGVVRHSWHGGSLLGRGDPIAAAFGRTAAEPRPSREAGGTPTWRSGAVDS